MSIDLITKEGYQQARSLGFIESPQEPIGAFKGSLSAIPLGVKRAWDIGSEALADVASPYVEDAAQYWIGDNAKEWVEDQKELSREIVRKGQRTQQEMGTVGQLLYSASGVITAAAIGGVTLGPAGAVAGTTAAMAAGGGLAGRERYLELKSQGVDAETAQKSAYVAGGTMAIGIGLAPYYGIRALTQVATGIGLNVGVGMADRYGTSAILEEAGYAKTAEHYKTLDGMSIAADAILGAAFPFAARAWKGLNTVNIDAALYSTEARQADTSMPSLPGRPQDIEAQAAAIDNIKEQMFADGKSAYDIVTPPMSDGAPNAKLAGEQMLTAKMFDEIILADPEMSSLRSISVEDFDIPTRTVDDIATKVEDDSAKVAEEYDAFLSQDAVRIAAEKPDSQVSVDGELVRAGDLETRFKSDADIAKQDSTLIRIATACAISRG